MNDDTATLNPRRLVVYFRPFGQNFSHGMIQDDEGSRPQLVHCVKFRHAPDPSLLQRIFSNLRLKPRASRKSEEISQWNYKALTAAHKFVSHNYRSGDQVILLAEGEHAWELINAMEFFARHLHNGTTPGKPSKIQPGGRDNAPGRRIPIYAFTVFGQVDDFGSMPWIDDELKSRFPPGIEHTIYYVKSDREVWCCSTVCDLDGGVISRKISIYDNDCVDWPPASHIHATKDIVYYNPEKIPLTDWDEQKPVWTKVLDSSPSGIPRKFPSSTLPAGIYCQELTRYQGGAEGIDRLVWKSLRN